MEARTKKKEKVSTVAESGQKALSKKQRDGTYKDDWGGKTIRKSYHIIR